MVCDLEYNSRLYNSLGYNNRYFEGYNAHLFSHVTAKIHANLYATVTAHNFVLFFEKAFPIIKCTTSATVEPEKFGDLVRDRQCIKSGNINFITHMHMTHSDDVIIIADKRQIKISPIIITLCLINGSSAKF